MTCDKLKWAIQGGEHVLRLTDFSRAIAPNRVLIDSVASKQWRIRLWSDDSYNWQILEERYDDINVAKAVATARAAMDII